MSWWEDLLDGKIVLLSPGHSLAPEGPLLGLPGLTQSRAGWPDFQIRPGWQEACVCGEVALEMPLSSLKPAGGEEGISKGSLQVPEWRLAFWYITLVSSIAEGEGMLTDPSEYPASHATFVDSGGS